MGKVTVGERVFEVVELKRVEVPLSTGLFDFLENNYTRNLNFSDDSVDLFSDFIPKMALEDIETDGKETYSLLEEDVEDLKTIIELFKNKINIVCVIRCL